MIAGATDVEGGAAAQRHFALCRVGDVLLAVPVAAVREALPVPAAFAVLPWRIDGLVGGVNRRGTVIPVIDPVRFLGIDATTPAPDAVVLVIECDERVLGLRVDVLVGMERVDAELVHSLAPLAPATGRAPLCVEAYGRPSGSDVVNVLDVRSLFRDTGLPLASEIRANNAHARSVVAGRGRPCLTFQCGELRFAIDAMLVHSVITEPALQPCRMPTAVWRHDVEHRGVRLAVLDLVRLAGLYAARTAQAPQVLVLRLPSGLVGLLADRIVDIVRIDTVDVRPIPALVVPRIELFSGVVEQDDGTRTLLMDSAGLAMDPGVAGMSRLNIATTPAWGRVRTGPRVRAGHGDVPALFGRHRRRHAVRADRRDPAAAGRGRAGPCRLCRGSPACSRIAAGRSRWSTSPSTRASDSQRRRREKAARCRRMRRSRLRFHRPRTSRHRARPGGGGRW